MPVQSQYPVGPFGQPAPSDNAQISQQIEGAVDFDRVSTQSPELSMSPPTMPGYWNSSQSRSADGHPAFTGEGYDFRQQHVLNEINGNRANDAPHRRTREMYMNHNNANNIINNNLKINNNNIGFHVDKEDFPALNQSLEKPPPVQVKAKTSTRAPPPCHPLQDNYDLESFVRLFQQPEFLRTYDELNFEDLLTRLTEINPLHKCGIKCKSFDPIPNIRIGVVLELSCSSIGHPEDPRTEALMAKTLQNYRVPLMQHDEFFCTTDAFKENLGALHYNALGTDTLFFIYYTFINDAQQMIAANNLFKEGWRYNKKMMAWCHLSSHVEPVNGDVKAAMFNVFNPDRWVIEQQFVCFVDGDFEDLPPIVPLPQPFFYGGFCNNNNEPTN